MPRFIACLAGLVIVGAVVVAPASSSSTAGRQLYGIVSSPTNAFTISLHEDGPDGDQVTSLRPGVYWLTVHDASAIHNFHLFGPGLDEVLTTVPFVGDVTVKIKLKHGEYTFQCDPHARTMKGTFEVGGAGQVDDDS